jgi:hypothetical protein
LPRTSNAVRLRLGGVFECLPRMAFLLPLHLGGMLERTGWAAAAGWVDAICWPVAYRVMQTARSTNVRAIAACIGIRALTTFIAEPIKWCGWEYRWWLLSQWRVSCNRYNHDADVHDADHAGRYVDESTDGDNSGNGGAGNHDADVHGADMLVVMVMRILMVTTVEMAGLLQPV